MQTLHSSSYNQQTNTNIYHAAATAATAPTFSPTVPSTTTSSSANAFNMQQLQLQPQAQQLQLRPINNNTNAAISTATVATAVASPTSSNGVNHHKTQQRHATKTSSKKHSSSGARILKSYILRKFSSCFEKILSVGLVVLMIFIVDILISIGLTFFVLYSYGDAALSRMNQNTHLFIARDVITSLNDMITESRKVRNCFTPLLVPLFMFININLLAKLLLLLFLFDLLHCCFLPLLFSQITKFIILFLYHVDGSARSKSRYISL